MSPMFVRPEEYERDLAALRALASGQIVSDRGIHRGIPVLRGTRIKAVMVAHLILDGLSNDEIRALYPAVTDEHVEAVRATMADTLADTGPRVE